MNKTSKLYLNCFNDVIFEHHPNFKIFSSKFNNIINLYLDEFFGFMENLKHESLDTICVICLNEATNKINLDCCKHEFCFECIKKWRKIKSTCPVCRKFIKSFKKSAK